jgi:hypothetical protein
MHLCAIARNVAQCNSYELCPVYEAQKGVPLPRSNVLHITTGGLGR